MVSRISCSITFPGTEVRLTSLQFPESSLLPFRKAGATFAVFQPLGTSASHYDLPKVTVSGLLVTVGSLCTRVFNPSGPSSQVLGLLKRSLTWSSSTTSKSTLFRTSLLVSQGPGSTKGWCSWQILSQRRHQVPQPFDCNMAQGLLPHSAMSPHFS